MRTPGAVDATNHFPHSRADEGIEKEEYIGVVRHCEQSGVDAMKLHVSRAPMFHTLEIAARDAGRCSGR